MIADDPDAPVGSWTHWVLFDLPTHASALLEGVSKVDEVSGGGRQGRNDFCKIGYGGPAPPKGKPHRYFFKLYSLDVAVGLNPGATKAQLMNAMKGNILAEGQLVGNYGR